MLCLFKTSYFSLKKKRINNFYTFFIQNEEYIFCEKFRFHGFKIMMEDIFTTYSFGCLTFYSMSRQLLHSLAYEQTYVTLVSLKMRMGVKKLKNHHKIKLNDNFSSYLYIRVLSLLE